MTADVAYANDQMSAVKITGGYEGTVVEGSPHVDWTSMIAYAYDSAARLANEDLSVTAFNKIYNAKPYGAERDDIAKIYPAMRVRRPLENVTRIGDLCGTAGATLLGNPIDLRPFYAITPNLTTALPPGVTRATVTFTYP